MGILGDIGSGLADAGGAIGRRLFGDNRARDAALDPKNAVLANGEFSRNYAQNAMQGAQGRGPGSMYAATIDPTQQAQIRGRQLGLADQLGRVASGQEMGAGELATRRQFAQGAASTFAGTAMARGANAGIAARAGARQLGDMTTNAAGASAQSALQDQAAARGLLGGLLDQTRGQDLSLATNQAGLYQDASGRNLQALMEQRRLNDAYEGGMFDRYLSRDDAELQARMQLAAVHGSQPKDGGIFGSALQMGGAALASYAGRPSGK